MKNKVASKIFEIVAYSILGLLGLWGLVYICLGFACEFIRYDTAVAVANDKLNLGFLWEGLIILGVAVVAVVFVLCIYAKRSDRDFEKAQRRAARLKKNVSSSPEVVDAEVAPVSESK